MVTENKFGLMVLFIKDSGIEISHVVLVVSVTQMEIFMKVTFMKASFSEQGRIISKTVEFKTETGKIIL